MKYLRGREVATSERKENFPKCSICGNKEPSMWLTIEHKTVCTACKSKDKEAEFVNSER